jgi:hypothetical protein
MKNFLNRTIKLSDNFGNTITLSPIDGYATEKVKLSTILESKDAEYSQSYCGMWLVEVKDLKTETGKNRIVLEFSYDYPEEEVKAK